MNTMEGLLVVMGGGGAPVLFFVGLYPCFSVFPAGCMVCCCTHAHTHMYVH